MGGGDGRDRSLRAEQEWAGLAEKDSGMQCSPRRWGEAFGFLHDGGRGHGAAGPGVRPQLPVGSMVSVVQHCPGSCCSQPSPDF